MGNSLVILGVLILDQAAKYLVQKNFGWLIVKNPGLPFGINLPGFFDAAAVVAALAIFGFFCVRYFSHLRHGLALGLILGGAISNLVDRARLGWAVDFIHLGISTINLADAAIIVGMVMLIKKLKIKR